MKLRFSFLFSALLMLVLFSIPETSNAQWGIGASYEIRNEDPTKGFGARIERTINLPVPLVNLGIRAHASYFSEENSLDVSGQQVSYSYSREISTIDYGIAALGKVKLGIVQPYAGAGIGGESLDVGYSDVQQNIANTPEDQSDSQFYFNGFVGAELGPVPVVKPFIEYRFAKMQEATELKDASQNTLSTLSDNEGRLIFGVILHF